MGGGWRDWTPDLGAVGRRENGLGEWEKGRKTGVGRTRGLESIMDMAGGGQEMGEETDVFDPRSISTSTRPVPTTIDQLSQ
jgi:hypothetical protein